MHTCKCMPIEGSHSHIWTDSFSSRHHKNKDTLTYSTSPPTPTHYSQIQFLTCWTWNKGRWICWSLRSWEGQKPQTNFLSLVERKHTYTHLAWVKAKVKRQKKRMSSEMTKTLSADRQWTMKQPEVGRQLGCERRTLNQTLKHSHWQTLEWEFNTQLLCSGKIRKRRLMTAK